MGENTMESQNFIYDGGTWDIEERTHVDVTSNYVTWKQGEITIVAKQQGILKIPMSHVVEVDFISSGTAQNSIFLRALIGIAVTGGAAVTGGTAVAAANGLSLLSSLKFGAFVGAFFGNDIVLTGSVVGALSNSGKKAKHENHCIISYLDESNPTDLKLVILDANASIGNTFVKDRKAFAEQLRSHVNRSEKAECVKAFRDELNKRVGEKECNSPVKEYSEFEADVKLYEELQLHEGKNYTFYINKQKTEGVVAIDSAKSVPNGRIKINLTSPVESSASEIFDIYDGNKILGEGKMVGPKSPIVLETKSTFVAEVILPDLKSPLQNGQEYIFSFAKDSMREQIAGDIITLNNNVGATDDEPKNVEIRLQKPVETHVNALFYIREGNERVGTGNIISFTD